MEKNNPNRQVFFTGDTSEIISDILKKYGLKESNEELEKKIFGRNPSFINSGLILETAIGIAAGNASYEQAKIDLQKQMDISQNIAEEIINEIKTKLVSQATTQRPVSTDKTKKEIEKSGVGVQEVPTPKRQLKNKKQTTNATEEFRQATPKPKQNRGPDNYREPIE